ncbi:MAG: chromosomal replication initiator protein DnaA [Verrucomicrobiota bacterium]|nr:chromosomal replication initiator protein DnaA [Verrucomicrobiota bacterium]
MEKIAVWAACCQKLQKDVNADTFQRWFSNLKPLAFEQDRLVLVVPNNIYQIWIEDNYLTLMKSHLASITGRHIEIEFRADDEPKITVRSKNIPPKPPTTREMLSPDKENVLSNQFTFETFVVGENNRFAHATAMGVATAPGKTYNPLFIHGGVGLGKTHLMHAIGHHVQNSKKGAKVVYISSEKFTNEFIDAIQNNALVKFRKKYRQADVLLIDDIQFLAGKARCQEEFFHTFNTLFEGHKQIIMSSDRPASEIGDLEKRLSSRFEWGMTAEIQAPDEETRLAILRKKMQLMNTYIPDDVVQFIAQKIRSNIRRLEGALIRIAVYASLCSKQITIEQVEVQLKDFLNEEAKKNISIDLIQRRVAERFDIRVADMTSKRRPANIAFPRQVAMYLSRQLTPSSLNEIGDSFGGRDHGTVIHACKEVKNRMTQDEAMRSLVNTLSDKMQRE